MRDLTIGERYVNLKSGATIAVIDPGNGVTCTIATVLPTGGTNNTRDISRASLYESLHTAAGKKLRTTGYVPARLLEKPVNPQPKPVATVSNLRDEYADLSILTNEQLVSYFGRLDAEAKDLAKRVDALKKEGRRRTRVGGTAIVGDVAYIAHRSKKFSPALAVEKLNEEELNMISVMEPDAKRAEILLDKKTYESLLEEQNWTLTVRTATDKDRENAASGKNPFETDRDNVVNIADRVA